MTIRHRLALLLAVASFGACTTEPGQPEPGITRQSIVNGELETGYAPVGALTWSVRGYRGSFCTGTLIAPQWVLTAAHCLTEQEGLVMRPEIVSFLVGTDARPERTGGPAAGTLHATESFHLHPDYETVYHANDIALVKLAAPISATTALPYNASMVVGPGDVMTYVGFGATEGVNKTGGGLKRRTEVAVTAAPGSVYFSEYMGSSPCFGDSGGPALLEVGGELRVVGVNSAVGGCDPAVDPSCPADPCERGVIVTRVDAYAGWIASVLGAPPPDCQQDITVCACPAACSTADGSCDNRACQTDDCEQVYGCLGGCGDDPNCEAACYARGTDMARDLLDAMLNCFYVNCALLPEPAFSQCAEVSCQADIQACLPTGTGPLPCEAVSDCIFQCAVADQTCQASCFEQGTAAAQEEYRALSQCVNGACAGSADVATCAETHCADALDTCFPPDNCSVTGGDCPANEACALRTTGGTDCLPSEGGQVDAACTRGGSALPCADGLSCVGGLCMSLCVLPQHCAADARCAKPTGATESEVGVCVAAEDEMPPEPVEPVEPVPEVDDMLPDAIADAGVGDPGPDAGMVTADGGTLDRSDQGDGAASDPEDPKTLTPSGSGMGSVREDEAPMPTGSSGRDAGSGTAQATPGSDTNGSSRSSSGCAVSPRRQPAGWSRLPGWSLLLGLVGARAAARRRRRLSPGDDGHATAASTFLR